jgi:hypothetical protein
LPASLLAPTASGRFGDTFARPTSTPLELDKPVVFDLSHVDDSDESLQATTARPAARRPSQRRPDRWWPSLRLIRLVGVVPAASGDVGD